MSRKGLAGTQNNNCQTSRTQVILLPCSDHHKLFLVRRSHPETAPEIWFVSFFPWMHTGALSRSQAEANNPVSNSASSTSSDVSTTASLNGSNSSLQSVHGISSSSADNSQSTPRARQGNSTLQDPTLELQAGEYLFLITTFCAFTCNKFYVF